MTRDVAVPAVTHPQLFPDDTYTADIDIQLASPQNVVVGVAVAAARGDLLVDWRTSATTHPDARTADGYVPAQLHLRLSRPTHLRLFVYAVAVAPLLLGIAAGFSWLRDRRSTGAPIELAAALLALLPLRQVLVPGDITGITRLDHLLGIEVVIIAVGVACACASTQVQRMAACQGTPALSIRAPLGRILCAGEYEP